jgi:hypothetical protein
MFSECLALYTYYIHADAFDWMDSNNGKMCHQAGPNTGTNFAVSNERNDFMHVPGDGEHLQAADEGATKHRYAKALP